MRPTHIKFFLAFACVLLAALSYSHYTSIIKLPADTSINAQVISIDNFYDPDKQSYTGEQRTIANYSLNPVKQENNLILLKNRFDVRTVDGELVVSITRDLAIDRTSREHQAYKNVRQRTGTLFAPPGLSKGESFTYWHVNYDAPARMEFVAEEMIGGLKVYRYHSDYEQQTIDQTPQLTHLPDVGERLGVILEPQLTLWIEPITGEMVNYTDTTTAYFYDLNTKEKLYPWNSFSNKLELSSIQDRVRAARNLAIITQTVRYILPIFLVATAALLIVSALTRKKYQMVISGIILVGALVTAGAIIQDLVAPKLASHDFNFTILVPSISPIDRSSETNSGFFEVLASQGYDNKSVNFLYVDGEGDEQALLDKLYTIQQIQPLDLIYVVSTPLTLSVKEIFTDVPIVFSAVAYPVEAGIIASNSSSENNLVGSRVYIPPEQQLQNFLKVAPSVKKIGVIRKKNEPNSQIQFEEFVQVGRKFDISFIDLAAVDPESLDQSLSQLTKEDVDAFYAPCDSLAQSTGVEVYFKHRDRLEIPDFTCLKRGVVSGSLIGTVPELSEVSRLAGELAIEVLEGISPSSLKTVTVSRPHIYVNSQTSQQLNVQIPQSLLLNSNVIVTNTSDEPN